MLKHVGKLVQQNDYAILSILYYKVGKLNESTNFMKKESENFPQNEISDKIYTKDKCFEKLFNI